jgi:hypothetical protein
MSQPKAVIAKKACSPCRFLLGELNEYFRVPPLDLPPRESLLSFYDQLYNSNHGNWST